MNRVAILAYDNLATFEFACAVELFGLDRPDFDEWYEADAVGLGKNEFSSWCDIRITVKQVNNFDGYDLLVLPGWRYKSADTKYKANLISALQRFYNNGGRIITFCTGAFLLAEAGLLDNRDTTTHWRSQNDFVAMFPHLNFIENVLYIYDGRIGCSAGSAAALDLGLEVIRQDFGHEIASEVARRLVIPPHRSGGQAQYVETPIAHKKGHLSETLDWSIKRLNKPLDVDAMANHANMSRRSFDRHFRASLGMSAKEWINRQRLHLAQRLLANKPASIEIVAQQAGFDNAPSMRHHFRKTFGISPTEYQSQFTA